MQQNPPSNDPGHDSNIVSLQSWKRTRREPDGKLPGGRPPLLNLPPYTKFLLITLLLIHGGLALALDDVQRYWVYTHLGFVPGQFTGAEPFSFYSILSLLTFSFLHGSWLHVMLNTMMLMAFGSGVERWIGGPRFLIFFMLCNVAAAGAQFLLDPFSASPVIGASGGLSGLFAAILVMMQEQARPGEPLHKSILPFALVWIAISVLFGFLGGPDGSTIAWAAHIGGFLAGFIFLRPVLRLRL